ncbi:hypothetical protein [Halosolutus halophilus]|nr:hypothetical protein [Halosolutus halophilus]
MTTGTVPDQRVAAEFAGRYGIESVCTVDGTRADDVPCSTAVLESR